MEKYKLFTLISFISYKGYGCVTCNQQIQDAIKSSLKPHFFHMFFAFVVLSFIVMILAFLSGKRHWIRRSSYPNEKALTPVPLVSAAMVLGIGIGGFIDGIVFHQILQWHEMISNKVPPVDFISKSVNVFWDGIFHAFALVFVIVGAILLWRLLYRKDIDRSGKMLAGGLMIGWGVFNLVEGLIDHHILKLHNVRDVTDNVDLWNFGFMVFSLIILLIGYLLTNQRTRSGRSPYRLPERM